MIATEGEDVQSAGVLISEGVPGRVWIVGRLSRGVKITLVGEGWWATELTHPSFARMGHPATLTSSTKRSDGSFCHHSRAEYLETTERLPLFRYGRHISSLEDTRL